MTLEHIDVTTLLIRVERGDVTARERLFAVVYQELRAVAQRRMTAVPPSETLQPTALVNEAYLRLFSKSAAPAWENRRHFFWAAARSMHDILVEKARRHKSLKRGGDRVRVPFEEDQIGVERQVDELLELSEALVDLESDAPRAAEVVRLRFFVGLTHAEAADALGISNATARREWAFAQAWLRRRMVTDDRSTPDRG